MTPRLALVLALAACGSSGDQPGAAPAPGERPAIADPLGFCERDRLALVRRAACFPEDASLKMAIDDLDRRVRTAPAEPAARRAAAAQCAIDLHGVMRAAQPAMCPLDMTEPEKTELAGFLAAWFGERTAPPATGDASADAALADLAKQRDAICACRAMDCARPLLAALGSPPDAPAAAATAGARIVDEARRCKQKLLLP